MSDWSYTNVSYRSKFRLACKTALIILVVCAVVVAPGLWGWKMAMEKHSALRDAKNIVLNMKLLGLEYYGYGKPVADKFRPSGLAEEAEETIRSFSGADGEIVLGSWNSSANRAGSLVYIKDHYLIRYQYDEENKKEEWIVYWQIMNMENEEAVRTP